MSTKRTCQTRRWTSIVILSDDGKVVDEFPLNEKELHKRKFKRSTRRQFPKSMNSSTPKEKIQEIMKLNKQDIPELKLLPIPANKKEQSAAPPVAPMEAVVPVEATTPNPSNTSVFEQFESSTQDPNVIEVDNFDWNLDPNVIPNSSFDEDMIFFNEISNEYI